MRTLRFKVENYESAHARDPMVFERLDEMLAEMGCIPLRVDVPTSSLVVSIENEDLKTEEVLATLDQLGLKAQLIGEIS